MFAYSTIFNNSISKTENAINRIKFLLYLEQTTHKRQKRDSKTNLYRFREKNRGGDVKDGIETIYTLQTNNWILLELLYT